MVINFWQYVILFIGGALGLVLSFIALPYATCPIYKFEEPKPFCGEKFYNPYQYVDSEGWHKCNFHAHSECWGGLTNGENAPEEILDAYRQLQYDAVSISNYMDIDTTNSRHPLYIPVYEHGYGIKKIHQLALGTRKVVRHDYIFLQNLNQKQHVVDLLKQHSRLVALCHPRVRNGYLPEDLKYLSNYDFIEVQNARRIYEEEWDAALSHGHKVWLIANDDAHSANLRQLQRSATFVNVSIPDGDEILERLAQGAALGVCFPKDSDTLEEKTSESEKVSFLKSIQVIENELYVIWQQNMKQIDFIGDNGNVLKTSTEADTAFYFIRPQDTYVRVRIISPEGFVYYLNPIIRYEGDKPVRQSLHSIDTPRTILKRAVIFLLGPGTLIGVVIIYVRAKRKNLSNF
jgi:hypothetical protein